MIGAVVLGAGTSEVLILTDISLLRLPNGHTMDTPWTQTTTDCVCVNRSRLFSVVCRGVLERVNGIEPYLFV